MERAAAKARGDRRPSPPPTNGGSNSTKRARPQDGGKDRQAHRVTRKHSGTCLRKPNHEEARKTHPRDWQPPTKTRLGRVPRETASRRGHVVLKANGIGVREWPRGRAAGKATQATTALGGRETRTTPHEEKDGGAKAGTPAATGGRHRTSGHHRVARAKEEQALTWTGLQIQDRMAGTGRTQKAGGGAQGGAVDPTKAKRWWAPPREKALAGTSRPQMEAKGGGRRPRQTRQDGTRRQGRNEGHTSKAREAATKGRGGKC